MPEALSLFQNLTAEAVNEVQKEWSERMLAFLEVLGLTQVRDGSASKVTSCGLDERGSTLILTTFPTSQGNVCRNPAAS